MDRWIVGLGLLAAVASAGCRTAPAVRRVVEEVADMTIRDANSVPPAMRAAVARALSRSGTRAELWRAWLRDTPAKQRAAAAFLLANMPDADLQTLDPEFVRENIALAYQARAAAPWGRYIPEDVFLDDVLPYAVINEARDPWRREFYDRLTPLVRDCATPGEAAIRLNTEIWKLFGVKYSTERSKPDQSPKESRASGLASCTGLSILLVDACRAVGVPARLVGIPLWPHKPGNHTWVEIWDGGRWHFTGAFEPGPLDEGWFVGDAARAIADDPLHCIYAASFRRTGLPFPCGWRPPTDSIQAINITDRYLRHAVPPDGLAELRLVAFDRRGGQRVETAVAVRDGERVAAEGRTRGETSDINDLLTFRLPPDRTYQLMVTTPDGRTQRATFTVRGLAPMQMEFYLED